MEETFLTVQQAADLLGIDPVGIRFRFIYGTLTRYHRDQVPEQFHQPKCRWYVAKSELDHPQSAAERRGWIDSKEAARILGVSEPTISYYVRTGRLTPLRLPAVGGRKGWKQYFEPEAVRQARDHRPARKEKPYAFSPEQTDCAYMAGIIDGEGSIVIGRRIMDKHVSHQVHVQITNTSGPLLDWVVEHFGGFFYEAVAESTAHRAWHSWRASGQNAAQILRLVLPYLVVKSRQAKLAIQFQERMDAYNAGRWHPLTDEELAWREQQKAEMSRLNRKD